MVAIHLPPWTGDPEIRTLIHRFQTVKQGRGDFAPMKIRPTTPDDPEGRYQRMTIYFFSDHSWTEAEVLSRYVNQSVGDAEDRIFRKEFESAARGGYEFDKGKQRGWIGPIGEQEVTILESES